MKPNLAMREQIRRIVRASSPVSTPDIRRQLHGTVTTETVLRHLEALEADGAVARAASEIGPRTWMWYAP